jgi:hypothetical protein
MSSMFSMSHALHTALQIVIALLLLVGLIAPTVFDDVDVDANEFDRRHLR